MSDNLVHTSTSRGLTPSTLGECRVCNRRRIKCDGARPACGKCISRGLQCPGYGKTLKWICGPASKGPNKLSFHTTPTHHGLVQPIHTSLALPPVIRSHEIAMMPYEHKQLPRLLSSAPTLGMENLLLKHFVDVVSIQLAWSEDESNPWRSIVLPLAMEPPKSASSTNSLLAVILGLSAGNIASRLVINDTQRGLYLQIMDSLRTQAFRFLSEDLRVLRVALQTGIRPPPQLLIETVVASVLLLSYLEVHWPSSGMWRFHLQAARNISNMLQFTATRDATNIFLSEELFTASTWPILTDYSPNERNVNTQWHGENRSEQQIKSHSSFTSFVVLMRRVAEARREIAMRGVESITQQTDRLRILQKALLDLEQAHEMVLRESRNMSSIKSHDFECIIAAYYYATQIYCYQALSTTMPKLDENAGGCSNTIKLLHLRIHLVDSLLSLDNPESLAQSQPWPLFVLGTVSAHDSVTQRWVEARMNRIMTLYCEIDRPHMLRFLKSFWGQDTYNNWIDYTQFWIQNHDSFLIL